MQKTETKNYKLYEHVNKINGKRYIGITKQTLNQRWRNGVGYKSTPHFYSAIQKYGWDNFEHNVLFDNLTDIEAFSLEKEYIKKYKTRDNKYGYNISEGGDSGSGIKGKQHALYGKKPKDWMSKESYKIWLYKMKHPSPFKKKPSKSVVCLNTKEIFSSITDACNKYKFSTTSVPECCIGVRKSAGVDKNGKHLVWRFLDDYNKLSEDQITKLINYKDDKCKQVICINNGMIFESISSATEYMGFKSNNSIKLSCIRKNNTAGRDKETNIKLKWMYLEDYQSLPQEEIIKINTSMINHPIINKVRKSPISVICLNTLQTFDSITDACKWCNYKSITGITQAIKGIRETAGFHPVTKEKLRWAYDDK